jgi:RNA polymerase sigma factor (sigma-70 family)
MFLQIEGVGKQKIQYKDHNAIEFDDLNTYLLLAKKSISKFANKYYAGLATKMLKDEEAISNIANAIMMADWRYDENHINEEGNKKTKYSYRNQCAIWAIQTYVTKTLKKNKKFKGKCYSLDYISEKEENGMHSYVKDCKAQNPEKIYIQKESNNELRGLIDKLMDVDCLSEKQKDFIKLYYFENYTFEQIGKQFNITREAVRQSLKKGISIIQKAIL